MNKKTIWLVSCLLSASALHTANATNLQLPFPVVFGTSTAEPSPQAQSRLAALNDFSQGPKYYFGGGIGYSSQSDICNNPFFSGSCSEGETTWRVLGGVRVNPMWGAELTYGKLGEASMDGSINNKRSAIKNELKTANLSAVGYLPITPQIEAFGKAGVAFWRRDSTITKEVANDASQPVTSGGTTLDPFGTHLETENSSDSGQSPVIGIGAQFRWDENIHIRGEWEHIFNVGSDSNYETDVDTYSVGLTYHTL